MLISKTNNNGQVTLALKGRLDTTSATKANDEIKRLLDTCSDIRQLTCDASQLEYISSSGLRILLSLSKRYPNFSIVEVSADVYQVLDVTGFTKIMTVEKALRHLSIEGCELIGIGGVGEVYRIDGDTIIKVFREGTTLEEVRKEINLSKEAFIMGMPTAISFDVVMVGSRYGLVYELLRADTLSVCVARHPDQVDHYARLYANLFRQMHAIHVPRESLIPSAVAHEEWAIRHISRYFDSKSIDLMLQIVQAVPKGDRLLHCDLQTKNAMMQNGELMLIDMGELGYGHPLTDLAHAYSAMVTLVGDYEKIIGMPQELGIQLWERAIGYYFEGLPTEMIDHRKAQIEVVSTIRNFSWLSLSDSFPDELIRECVQLFDERVASRKDYILDVCSTLTDWELL